MRVSRKLTIVIVVHLLHAAILLGVTTFGMDAMSASRAYVEAEGQWSKAQKAAVLELLLYAETGDEAHYRAYQQEIRVTLGDRQARLEMEKESPDMEVLRAGFVQGRVHPDDVEKMVWLFRTFSDVSYIHEAIDIWTRADATVVVLEGWAQELRDAHEAPDHDPERIALAVEGILATDAELTTLETDFSRTLGEGSRWLTQVVVVSTLGLTALFVGSAAIVSSLIARHLIRSLGDLESGATRLAEGDLGGQIDAAGKDEVSRVAKAFNAMSERLAKAVSEKDRQAAVTASSLREKESLLKEIHHRVKNNLQVTSALLLLQSEQARDEGSRQLFIDSMSRIKSMALVHEKLYASKNLESIDFDDYVRHLVSDLRMCYAGAERGLEATTDVAPGRMQVDLCVNLGLIVNELVSNAFKHAFPDGRSGHVWVSVVASDPGRFTLSVRDDGVGLPAGFNITATSTLGLQLVRGLVTQIDGALTVAHSGGTEFRVTFPAPGLAVRPDEPAPLGVSP